MAKGFLGFSIDGLSAWDAIGEVVQVGIRIDPLKLGDLFERFQFEIDRVRNGYLVIDLDDLGLVIPIVFFLTPLIQREKLKSMAYGVKIKTCFFSKFSLKDIFDEFAPVDPAARTLEGAKKILVAGPVQ